MQQQPTARDRPSLSFTSNGNHISPQSSTGEPGERKKKGKGKENNSGTTTTFALKASGEAEHDTAKFPAGPGRWPQRTVWLDCTIQKARAAIEASDVSKGPLTCKLSTATSTFLTLIVWNRRRCGEFTANSFG